MKLKAVSGIMLTSFLASIVSAVLIVTPSSAGSKYLLSNAVDWYGNYQPRAILTGYESPPEMPNQYVCTFFYPWYSHYWHWDQGGHHPPDTWAANYLPDIKPEVFDPATELYNSKDDTTILWQLNLMKRACIRVAISSWWGKNAYSDSALRKIIAMMVVQTVPYRDLKWCIYYEQEGYGDPSVDEICDNLRYVINNYGISPYYFKLNGKYVVFVYADPNDGASYAQRWNEARNRLGNVFIVLKVFMGYQNYADCADSWHQYAPQNRYESHGGYAAYASAGFWKYHEAPRLTRDANEFDLVVRLLRHSGCTFLITYWNEWHEGSQIEPGQLINHDDSNPPFTPAAPSYGYTYVDIVRSHMQSLMPTPVSIEYTMPSNNSVLRNTEVTVEIKVKDPYSNTVDAYISLDGGNFQQMILCGQDGDGYLYFNYTTTCSIGSHCAIVYTKDGFDYFSSNFRLNFAVETRWYKPELQIPWIWLTTIILLLVLTVVYVKKRKRHADINS